MLHLHTDAGCVTGAGARLRQGLKPLAKRAGAHAGSGQILGWGARVVVLLVLGVGHAGAGADRLRPPRRRLPEIRDPLRRSGRLRRALRARRALPGLEFLLSAHRQRARHLLAEEQGAAAGRGQMLHLGRARRRRDRAARGALEYSIDRFGGDYRSFELAADPAGAGCRRACEGDNAAAPGPMCGPAISARRRAAISRTRSRARATSRAAFPAWCGSQPARGSRLRSSAAARWLLRRSARRRRE